MCTESSRYAVGNRPCLLGIVGTVLLIGTLPLAAQTTVTPQARAPLNVTTVLINGSAGAQTDPHVSQDIASYTDQPSGQIRYYNFATSADLGISNVLATGEVVVDYLSDACNTNIVFTRNSSIGSDIELFDTVSGTLTTIDSVTNPIRQSPAIGGNTIAYADIGFNGASGEIVVHDIASNTATRLTNDTADDEIPQVAPNGQVVVWRTCSGSSCDIKQAVLSATAWAVSSVTSTPEIENNPDTDGTYVVYDSNRSTSNAGSDVYFKPVAGGTETQLSIPGFQTNPSIAAGIIAFQSSPDGVQQPNDLFVYRISTNELFQVTNTPTTNEVLNDITVLPNGAVRLVWSTDGAESDVLATTFTLPPPPSTYNFTGFFQPVDNLPTLNSVKAGSAVPVKFSLGGYQGLDIAATGYPASQPILCSTSVPTDQIEQTVTAGASSLSYDATTDQYNYVWKTDKSWAGTCRQLTLMLKDGTSHSANFEFTK